MSRADGRWAAASTQSTGAAGEMLVAARFALLGLTVYTPLADERGVDLLVDLGDGHHLKVQVKTIRPVKGRGSYVFARKKYFRSDETMPLALVVLAHDREQPEFYLIPGTAWLEEPLPRPLVSNDYENLKSDPEFGINISSSDRSALETWPFDEVAAQLTQEPATPLTPRLKRTVRS